MQLAAGVGDGGRVGGGGRTWLTCRRAERVHLA